MMSTDMKHAHRHSNNYYCNDYNNDCPPSQQSTGSQSVNEGNMQCNCEKGCGKQKGVKIPVIDLLNDLVTFMVS